MFNPKDLWNKLKFYVLVVGVPVIVGLCILLHYFQVHKRDILIVSLQNQLASQSKTIEDNKGLFEKQVIQTNNVQSTLDSSNQQIKELEAQLKKSNETLSDETTATLSWKNAYKGLVTAKQTQVSVDGGTTVSACPNVRERVDFNKDFGYIAVDGYTLTNPPEGYVDVQQKRPLQITVATSQDKTGVWHSYITSSDSNVSASILVSAVNPYIRERHWFEKLALQLDLGFGTTPVGVGALGGVGGTLDLGDKDQFTVGPHLWLMADNNLNKIYGATFAWHPFAKKE